MARVCERYPSVLFHYSREDEHALIQQYCQTLGGESPVSQPQSPAQILKSVEKEERGELERIIADLEEEQRSGHLPFLYLNFKSSLIINKPFYHGCINETRTKRSQGVLVGVGKSNTLSNTTLCRQSSWG